RERAADPATADRSLLELGRQLLWEKMQENSLEPHVVHLGESLLSLLGDHLGVVDLLSRYLTQPLSVDEEAWARWHLVDNLALSGRWPEVVARQQDFLKWAKEVFPDHPPSLARDIPFEPVGGQEEETLSQDSLLFWVMGDATQAEAWMHLGKADEWLGIFETL